MTGLVAAAAEFSTRRPSPSPTRWGRARAASRVSNNNANRATTLAGSRRGQVGPGPARDGDRRSAPTCLRCGLVLVVRRRGGGDDDSPVPGSAGSSGRADRAILGGPLQSRRKHVVGSECTRDVSRRDLLLLLQAPWPALLSAYNALTGQIELGSTNFSWCSCCPTMRGVVHARIRDLTTYVLQLHANNNATMRRTVHAWREARGVQGVRERTLASACAGGVAIGGRAETTHAQCPARRTAASHAPVHAAIMYVRAPGGHSPAPRLSRDTASLPARPPASWIGAASWARAWPRHARVAYMQHGNCRRMKERILVS